MAEKILALILRGSGILMLTALIAVGMPFSWMQEIHSGLLGMGNMPGGPIVEYLARSLSLLYALHGALLYFLARDVTRFLPVIKCFAILGVVFGAIIIFLDIAVGMPTYWILGEGPLIIPLGIVLFWLAGRVKNSGGPCSKRNE
ncbi:MAG: hypothetical protein JXR49_07785 [Acidobacteria bacterium]|nr:hypothetical protein [Acidobacteriota bacterium]